MENKSNDLSLRFQSKGFTPIEIPGLIKDIGIILDEGRYCTITEVNQELDDLVWGVEIIDNVTYKLMNPLIQ